jgi:hypothetical protein
MNMHLEHKHNNIFLVFPICNLEQKSERRRPGVNRIEYKHLRVSDISINITTAIFNINKSVKNLCDLF